MPIAVSGVMVEVTHEGVSVCVDVCGRWYQLVNSYGHSVYDYVTEEGMGELIEHQRKHPEEMEGGPAHTLNQARRDEEAYVSYMDMLKLLKQGMHGPIEFTTVLSPHCCFVYESWDIVTDLWGRSSVRFGELRR